MVSVPDFLEKCVILSPEEIEALWYKWKREGDKEAFDKLVLSQLRLAYQIADRFGNKKFVQDLKAEAALAVIEALSLWDPSRGRLTTITTVVVRQRLARYLQSVSRVVHVPYCVFRKLKDEENKCESGVLSLDDLLQKAKDVVDNSVYLSHERNFDIESKVDDLESVEHNDQLVRLRELVNELEGRKGVIVKEYFGIGCTKKTLKQLSAEYNLSIAKIKGIINLGLEDLKRKMGEEN